MDWASLSKYGMALNPGTSNSGKPLQYPHTPAPTKGTRRGRIVSRAVRAVAMKRNHPVGAVASVKGTQMMPSHGRAGRE